MRASKQTLEESVERGRLEKLLSKYIESCRPPPDADPKRAIGRFPNIAGFCRFLGCGIQEFEALRLSMPTAASYISTVLEDEALNSHSLLSPTLAVAYLKRRLEYGEHSEAGGSASCGEMRLIFEHNIEEDGE